MKKHQSGILNIVATSEVRRRRRSHWARCGKKSQLVVMFFSEYYRVDQCLWPSSSTSLQTTVGFVQTVGSWSGARHENQWVHLASKSFSCEPGAQLGTEHMNQAHTHAHTHTYTHRPHTVRASISTYVSGIRSKRKSVTAINNLNVAKCLLPCCYFAPQTENINTTMSTQFSKVIHNEPRTSSAATVPAATD